MMGLRSLMLALACVLSTGARADCNLQAMVGAWKCAGQCTPGKEISVLSQLPDGRFGWNDPLRQEGVVVLGVGERISVRFGNGESLDGSIANNCQLIIWNGGRSDARL